MSEKELKVRIQQKHDIEANWIKATSFVPKAGEIIIYDADDIHLQPRIKIGNGITVVSDLDFVDSTDSTVPAWAKEPNKPTYTKSEVGLGSVDNVRQYSASNPPIVVQNVAPTDTSVMWVDLNDNDLDDFSDAVNTALAQAKASGEFDGADGEDGYTPQLGVDYWTEDDVAEIKSYIDSKLSDTGGESQEVFVDVLKDVGYMNDMRINSSGGIVEWTSTDADTTGYIPCKTGDIIRVKNMPIPATYTSGAYWNKVAAYDANKTHLAQTTLNVDFVDTAGLLLDAVEENGYIVQFTVKEAVFGANVAYIAISAQDITDDSEVYVNSTIVSGESGIPEYWLGELAVKAEAIQTAMETAGRNKSAFLWYTDAHWQTNSKMSPTLLKYLVKNTPINKVNFGGDIINDPSTFTHENIKYAYEWRKQIAEIPNHHSVPGNHDLNHNNTDVRNMAYAFLIAPEESSDMTVGDGLYYYIDNNAEKTRYIYLDFMTSNHSEMVAQGQFIVNAISSVKEGWHVVVIAHRWFQYTSASTPTVGSVPNYEKEILKIFDEYNARGKHTESNYFSAQDFAGGKGKVEFCIGGHIHVDYDFTTDGGIPVIITASDTNQDRSSDETEDSGTVGTITESAVFGIVANYNTNKITVVGVGRGTNRVISY